MSFLLSLVSFALGTLICRLFGDVLILPVASLPVILFVLYFPNIGGTIVRFLGMLILMINEISYYIKLISQYSKSYYVSALDWSVPIVNSILYIVVFCYFVYLIFVRTPPVQTSSASSSITDTPTMETTDDNFSKHESPDSCKMSDNELIVCAKLYLNCTDFLENSKMRTQGSKSIETLDRSTFYFLLFCIIGFTISIDLDDNDDDEFVDNISTKLISDIILYCHAYLLDCAHDFPEYVVSEYYKIRDSVFKMAYNDDFDQVADFNAVLPTVFKQYICYEDSPSWHEELCAYLSACPDYASELIIPYLPSKNR